MAKGPPFPDGHVGIAMIASLTESCCEVASLALGDGWGGGPPVHAPRHAATVTATGTGRTMPARVSDQTCAGTEAVHQCRQCRTRCADRALLTEQEGCRQRMRQAALVGLGWEGVLVDDVQRRKYLISAAAMRAWWRVGSANPMLDEEKSFAAVGELLFWIVAAKETFAASKLQRGESRDLVLGLGLARDRVAHGDRFWRHSQGADVFTDTYTDYYGALIWTEIDTNPRDQDRAELYDRTCRGQGVLDTTRKALQVLGIWSDAIVR
jgi:hypothetical protein